MMCVTVRHVHSVDQLLDVALVSASAAQCKHASFNSDTYTMTLTRNCVTDYVARFRRFSAHNNLKASEIDSCLSRRSANLGFIRIIHIPFSVLDSGKIVCGVFLDLQKAFDTVQHNILLQKLFNYGVRGIVQNWFHSYLNQRCHYTVIGKVNSPMSFVNCGIPQGSVLCPLLFLVYINSDIWRYRNVF